MRRLFRRRKAVDKQADEGSTSSNIAHVKPQRTRRGSISSLNPFRRHTLPLEHDNAESLYRVASNETEDLMMPALNSSEDSYRRASDVHVGLAASASPTASPIDVHDEHRRWPFPKTRRRAGSILSLTSHREEGVVLESFRTVVRVREEPRMQSATSSPDAPSAMTDYWNSPRPATPTITSRPSSPTISVEAFRQAAAQRMRSRSTSSLASLASSGSEGERPRFEPLRRSSGFVDDVDTADSEELLPPQRPFVASSTVVKTRSASASDDGETSAKDSIQRDEQDKHGTMDFSDEMRMIALFGEQSVAPPSPIKTASAYEASRDHTSNKPLSRPVLSPLQVNSPVSAPHNSRSESPARKVTPASRSVAPTVQLSKMHTWEWDSDGPSRIKSSPNQNKDEEEENVPLAQLSRSRNGSVLSLPLTIKAPLSSVHKATLSAVHVRSPLGMSQRSTSALSLATAPRIPPPLEQTTPFGLPARRDLYASRSSVNLSSTSSLWTRAGGGLSPASSMNSLVNAGGSPLKHGDQHDRRDESRRVAERAFDSASALTLSTPFRPSIPSSNVGLPKSSSESNDVFDRMRARHRSTTPSIVSANQVPPLARTINCFNTDNAGDDDRPLASLRTTSMPANMSMWTSPPLASPLTMPIPTAYATPWHAPSFGAWPAAAPPMSSYAFAPVGVDPMLYASLPNDQKMMLHQRANEMMLMMAQAAHVARAQSDIGLQQTSLQSSTLAGQHR